MVFLGVAPAALLSIPPYVHAANFDMIAEIEYERLPAKRILVVHGAEDLMTNLQRELAKAYDPKQVDFLMPKNCQPVQIHFHGDRMAKVVGSLASQRMLASLRPQPGR